VRESSFEVSSTVIQEGSGITMNGAHERIDRDIRPAGWKGQQKSKAVSCLAVHETFVGR
jgi:hypothetical protein